MICPQCGHDNLPGSEECSQCLQDLTQLDRPVAHNNIERSLMEDTVSDLNPAEPITIGPRAPLREAISSMLGQNVGALLVVGDDGRLLGILSERDLLTKAATSDRVDVAQPVSRFMTPDPETVTATDTLAFALHKMDVGGYRHLPILCDDRPAGVISVRDMLRHITRMCRGS